MKTKRRAWVVVVVVLLAIVVTMPLWDDMWLAVAYERVPIDDRHPRKMYYLRKRVVWLPGADLKVPSQECVPCSLNIHWDCIATVQPKNHMLILRDGSLEWARGEVTPAMLLLADWHCICSDASHKDKP